MRCVWAFCVPTEASPGFFPSVGFRRSFLGSGSWWLPATCHVLFWSLSLRAMVGPCKPFYNVLVCFACCWRHCCVSLHPCWAGCVFVVSWSLLPCGKWLRLALAAHGLLGPSMCKLSLSATLQWEPLTLTALFVFVRLAVAFHALRLPAGAAAVCAVFLECCGVLNSKHVLVVFCCGCCCGCGAGRVGVFSGVFSCGEVLVASAMFVAKRASLGEGFRPGFCIGV